MIPDDQLVSEATVVAEYFHANAPDGGRRLDHVKRTAALVPANHGPLCQAVALMHHTPADATGFPPVVTGAVQTLRRLLSESTTDHLRRIADNAIATCVYRAHLLDEFRTCAASPNDPALRRTLDGVLVADTWLTRHVLGYQSVLNESAARAAGGDGADFALPHVATMPAEVEAQINAVVARIASEACSEMGGSATEDEWVRARVDEVLHIVSVQVREDLAGLADEQPLPNFAEDDYAGGYRHAMIDAQQLRSLS